MQKKDGEIMAYNAEEFDDNDDKHMQAIFEEVLKPVV